MFRIVRTRTLQRLQNRADKEHIQRVASDNTAARLLDLRDAVYTVAQANGIRVGGYDTPEADVFAQLMQHLRREVGAELHVD